MFTVDAQPTGTKAREHRGRRGSRSQIYSPTGPLSSGRRRAETAATPTPIKRFGFLRIFPTTKVSLRSFYELLLLLTWRRGGGRAVDRISK